MIQEDLLFLSMREIFDLFQPLYVSWQTTTKLKGAASHHFSCEEEQNMVVKEDMGVVGMSDKDTEKRWMVHCG